MILNFGRKQVTPEQREPAEEFLSESGLMFHLMVGDPDEAGQPSFWWDEVISMLKWPIFSIVYRSDSKDFSNKRFTLLPGFHSRLQENNFSDSINSTLFAIY